METARTLVGRTYKNAYAWLALILAPVCLLIGGSVVQGDFTVGIAFLAVGGLLLVAAIGVFLWVKAGRVWLTLHEAGFCIEDGSGLHEFREEDVESIAYAQETVLRNGTPSGSRHQLQLWLTGRADAYRLAHSAPLAQKSLLEELSGRCHGNLAGRTRQALEQSGSFEGAGWRIDNQQFHIPNPVRPESFRWDEFSAVEVFDEHVCLWLKGEQEPKFRFPVASQNALLLMLLARERLPKAPEGAVPDVEGLGRVLFQRGNKSWRFLMLIGAAGFIGGLALVGTGEYGWGTFVAGCGVAFLLWAFGQKHTHFLCHERGVCLAKWVEKREIRFEEVDVFTYSATRHYYNGAYTGTVYQFEFQPRADTGKKPIRYVTTISGQDQEMDHLRDHIAKVIAVRMARDLAAGQPASWTPSLRFLPTGLEFRPAGFLGRKEPVAIPYETIRASNLNEGNFYIWVKDREKPVVQVSVSEPNFFPGYFLYLSMSAPDERKAAVPAESGA